MFWLVLITLLAIFSAYIYLQKLNKKELIQTFTVWIIFSVLLALSPIAFNYLLSYLSGKSPDFSILLQNGELFIVSVAIGAGAAGQLIGSGQNNRTLKIISAGGCFILVIISSFLFAAISTSLIPSIDPDRVSNISTVMFNMTIISSGSCIILEGV